MRAVVVFLGIGFILGLGAIAGLGTATSYTIYGYTSSYYGNYWTPASLTANQGDTTTWAIGAGYHTLVSDSTGLASCASLPCTQTLAPGTYHFHCGIHGTAMSGTITIAVPPTVTISNPPANGAETGTFIASGTASDAYSPITSVSVQVDGGAPGAAQLSGSANSVTWTATIDSTQLANGAHTLVVVAHTQAQVSGTATAPFTVTNPTTIDLAVTSVSDNTGTTSVPIFITVANRGNTNSGAFDTLLEYQMPSDASWHVLGHVSFPSIAGFSQATNSFTWHSNGAYLGRFAVRATANDLGQVPETDQPDMNNQGLGSASFVTSAIQGVVV
jgi:hypothetical protein